jgi:maltose O-acetyltransferase
MLTIIRKILKEIALLFIGEITTARLIKRGLVVGENFNRQQGCFIDPTHCWLITIGDNVTFSIRVVLLAHDASTKHIIGCTKIGKIKIGNNVFIGANSTVMPNVSIGDNSIIGANSIVTKDIPPNSVVAGNPAKVICSIDTYKVRNIQLMHQSPVFGEEYTMRVNLTKEKKNKMIHDLNRGMGYIE